MALFWVVAAAMIAVALALVLPPLLGRARQRRLSRHDVNVAVYRQRLAALEQTRESEALGDDEYTLARDDLERSLSDEANQPSADSAGPTRRSPFLAALIALALPGMALALYLHFGAWEQMQATEQASAMPDLEQAIERLAKRLKAQPDNPQGWLMLGRSFATLGRLSDARDALEEAYRRQPDSPEVLLEYAQTLARLQDDSFSGQPQALIEQALRIAPELPEGLWVAGIAAFQQQRYQRALGYWERLRALGELNDEQSRLLAAFVARAREQLGQAAAAAAAPGSEVTRELTVQVALAPDLAAKASPDDTVFIYVRAAEGPGMPLAAVRKRVRDLPTSVVLGDAQSLSPARRMSQFAEVVVGARISASGLATPAAGDLQGVHPPVRPDEVSRIEITIDEVVP
jgi:cytochrome c-type biogenesis protein CcmH